MVIFPYRHHGTWVFDDEQVGLVQEPFVSGIPEMVDVLVKNIPNVDEGFRLIFSATPFIFIIKLRKALHLAEPPSIFF